MNRLVAAVLIKAIDDWEDPKFQLEIKEFLDTEWFGQLVEFLELEPHILRARLLAGEYKHLEIRAAYRFTFDKQ